MALDFVLDLATNGEMQSLISRLGSLSARCTQYYTAQIVDALDYMHSKGVIHRSVPHVVHLLPHLSLNPTTSLSRDLKPENLLLDADFRLKITDFGTAKVLNADGESSIPDQMRSSLR